MPDYPPLLITLIKILHPTLKDLKNIGFHFPATIRMTSHGRKIGAEVQSAL